MAAAPRVAIAGILHESNTFSPSLTGRAAFEGDATCRGQEIERMFGRASHEVGGFLAGARDHHLEAVPTLVANATPSGPVSEQAFESLTAELLLRLRRARPLDGVLLALHGAMVAERHAAADLEVLRRVRSGLGRELPVVVTHDAHANVAPEMAQLCSALVIYKEVPHIDQFQTGRRAASIMQRILGEGLRPAQAIAKPPMLYNILFHDTSKPPMLPLVQELKRLEREDGRLLAASAAVGFQYADVPQMGPSIVVVTDGDEDLARREARRLADLMWSHRLSMHKDLPGPREAVRIGKNAARRPAVLVDLGDNIGGGSPGDGTALLRELLLQRAAGFVVAIFDPQSASEAFGAGVGARFDSEVGGSPESLQGEPCRVRGQVKLLYDGRYTEEAARHGGMRHLDQGPTAVIEAETEGSGGRGLVLLTSRRHPPFSLGQLTSAGIDPAQQRILVVKAAVAFRAAYEPVAGTIVLADTPGLTAVNPSRFRYQRAPSGLYLTGPSS